MVLNEPAHKSMPLVPYSKITQLMSMHIDVSRIHTVPHPALELSQRILQLGTSSSHDVKFLYGPAHDAIVLNDADKIGRQRDNGQDPL